LTIVDSRGDRDADLGRATGQMRDVVGDQPRQVSADVDPPRALADGVPDLHGGWPGWVGVRRAVKIDVT
jgi:hypothetical protein